MSIHVLSDLHLEFADFAYQTPPCDVVVIAGDLHVKARGMKWLVRQYEGTPVVYVAGNHEYYGAAIPKLTSDLTSRYSHPNVHFLERSSVAIGGIVFVGVTLWTDFELFGDRDRGMAAAADVLNDYRRIRVSPEYRRLRPTDTLKLHWASVSWLRAELARHQGRCVVVTHHAPSVRSVAPAEQDDLVSAAYASDLEELILATQPLLWIHGHTHHRIDYRVGSTRVLSNPRGYADEPVSGFDPRLVIDLSSPQMNGEIVPS